MTNPLAAYMQAVENALEQIQLPGKPKSLYEPVNYIMALGGKRIRPVLTLLACDAFGGNWKANVQPALAMEVFHNFTLIHDDLMDNAGLRRGKQTVHEKWNSSTAILSGDVMLVLAYDLLLNIDAAILPQALQLFNTSAKKVCEGQQLDMEFEGRAEVSIAEYIEMIGLKTAALLAGSLQLGALLAGATVNNQELIYKFGYTIGTAFQVQDDLLDVYGDEKFGKKIGGDIAANKKTYLTLKAFELAGNAESEKLKHFYSGAYMGSAEEKIAGVMEIYASLKIKEQTEQARDAYYNEAMQCLDAVSADESKKEVLRKLAAELINREK